MRKLLIALLAVLTLGSCVGKKKYTQLQFKYEDLTTALNDCDRTVRDIRRQNDSLRNELAISRSETSSVEKQMETIKKTNENLLERMSDLSIVSKAGAESIQKSLEAINKQSSYIEKLTGEIKTKDSLNLALVTNLKRSLDDVDDKDIEIAVKKGIVHISISDKMLFKSGSSEIGDQAGVVLSKVAKIINDRKDLEVLVEGHTDNVPISNNCIKDNWDLSAKRATSIVRTLQTQYGVNPARLTAGGRSEFVPKASNATDVGRSVNRRTEIILTPKLDEFFELLVPESEE
jgi:chemotaxis protein MotB